MAHKKKTYESYLKDFADELRDTWLNTLFQDTVAGQSNIISNNWRRTEWRPVCFRDSYKHTTSENKKHYCLACEWRKIYNARYYNENIIEYYNGEKDNPERKKVRYDQIEDNDKCPLVNIGHFVNHKSSLKNNKKAKAGLKQLLDFCSLWLWFLDEVSGTIYFPKAADGIAGLNSVAEKFVSSMVLPIGKGSNGYALRINKGICMEDTFADPRGGVSIEDIVARNFSYMAVPIREEEYKNSPTYDKGKIIAYVALSYPLPYAWHKKEDTEGYKLCSLKNANETKAGKPVLIEPAVIQNGQHPTDNEKCFYKTFSDFINNLQAAQNNASLHCGEPGALPLSRITFDKKQSFANRIRTLYSSMQNDKLSGKISQATRLGDRNEDGEQQRWQNYLNSLCLPDTSKSDEGQVDLSDDALGINFASIFRFKTGAETAVENLATNVNSEVREKHIQNLISRSFRHEHLQGFNPSKYYDGHGFSALDDDEEDVDQSIIIRFIKHEITTSPDKSETKESIPLDKSKLAEAKETIRAEVEGRLKFIKLLTDEGFLLYRKAANIGKNRIIATDSKMDVSSEYKIELKTPAEKIAYRKLYEGFADAVLGDWYSYFDETASRKVRIDEAICYWHYVGALKNEVIDGLIEQYEKCPKKSLGQILDNNIGKNIVQSVCVYINMPAPINEELYYPSYSSDTANDEIPWALIGDDGKDISGIKNTDFVNRNFKSYDTYKVISSLVNYAKLDNDGTKELTKTPENNHISSDEAWTNILTEKLGFNYFYKVEVADKSTKDAFCVLYKGNSNSKININNNGVRSLKDFGEKIEKLIKSEKDKTTKTIEKPCLTFHMRKASPYAYVQIPVASERKEEQKAFRKEYEQEVEKYICAIAPDIKKLNEHSKDPIFLWNVYEGHEEDHSIQGKWKPGEALDQAGLNLKAPPHAFHQHGCHSLFVQPITDNEISLGCLLFGRSLFHPEDMNYSLLDFQEQQVVYTLINYATHIFSLKHEEERRINALRGLAVSQAHEMRNALSSLIGLSDIHNRGIDHPRSINRFKSEAGNMISAVEDIIETNNAVEAAHQRRPEVNVLKKINIAEKLKQIWNEILNSDKFHGFKKKINDIYNHDIGKIEIIGNCNHVGSLPKASIKMILKELLKNAIKYSDYCYFEKNEKAHKITLGVTLNEDNYVLDFGNGVAEGVFYKKASFAYERYKELKLVSYGFINTPSSFSTNIGFRNIQDYILANYEGDIKKILKITEPTSNNLFYSVTLTLPYETKKD